MSTQYDTFRNLSSTTGYSHERSYFPFMHVRTNDMQQALQAADVNTKIACYLHASDIDELYGYVLDRIERLCGRAVTAELLGLLWGSRYGLSRAELVAITGRRERAVAHAVAAISHHLLLHDDLLSLSPSLRSAVAGRYLANAALRREVRGTIARHFTMQPLGVRRAVEEPWQLHEAGEWGALADALADPALALFLAESGERDDLMLYWRAIDRRGDLLALYEAALEAHDRTDRDALRAATLYNLLGEFYCERGDDERSELLLRRGLAIRLAILGGDDAATIEIARNLATLQNAGYDCAGISWPAILKSSLTGAAATEILL